MPYNTYDNDEESTPLVISGPGSRSRGGGGGGGGGSRSNGTSSSNSTMRTNAIILNRILIILLAVGFVGVSIFFQYEETQFMHQLEVDEEKMDDLQHTIDDQASIIQRFNESVTNSDVLQRLQLLENDLTETKSNLQTQLQQTLAEVQKELDATISKLDETVATAESEIHNQVDTVKVNFDKYVVQTEAKFSMENSFMVYQLAGTITLLSCLISMWHMTAHIQKMNQPVIQRKILAILWMSPIYAITSWFSLVFPPAEGWLAIIKDGYEAYIIYQFLSFCIAVLGKGDRAAVVDLLTKRADHLTPPFRLFPCCNKPHYENAHALADAILLQCQFFALQFVFFRPITTIAKVLLNKYEYYGPFGATSANDWRAPQVYVTVIQNISIFTAFAGLLKFYHAVDKDLEWCRPFAKFLCIKGVVFMTFWQGLAITILAETTDVGGDSSDSEEWASSAQNFLICLEMLLFSIAHFYCFPTYEWEPNYRANFNKAKYGIKEQFALGDFVADLKLIMKGSNKKRKSSKTSASKEPSEPSVPEEGETIEDDDQTSLISDATGNDNTSVASSSKGATSPARSLAEDVANVLADDSDMDNPERDEVKRRIDDFLNDTAFLPGDIISRKESNNDLMSEAADSTTIKSREDDEKIAESQEEEIINEATTLAAVRTVEEDDDWVAMRNDGDSEEEQQQQQDVRDDERVGLPYGSADNSQDDTASEPSFRGIDWAKDDDEEDPSEKTSLLGSNGGGTGAPSTLQPSIFTKIADISND